MSLLDRLNKLRLWIKQLAKKYPDKYCRGFADSLTMVAELLDEIESVIRYCDDIQLAYYRRLKNEMDEKSINVRHKLSGGSRDESGTWIPPSLTDDETNHLIFVMMAKIRDENLEGWSDNDRRRMLGLTDGMTIS